MSLFIYAYLAVDIAWVVFHRFNLSNECLITWVSGMNIPLDYRLGLARRFSFIVLLQHFRAIDFLHVSFYPLKIL